jgi:hypothetical protein
VADAALIPRTLASSAQVVHCTASVSLPLPSSVPSSIARPTSRCSRGRATRRGRDREAATVMAWQTPSHATTASARGGPVRPRHSSSLHGLRYECLMVGLVLPTGIRVTGHRPRRGDVLGWAQPSAGRGREQQKLTRLRVADRQCSETLADISSQRRRRTQCPIRSCPGGDRVTAHFRPGRA